MIKVMGYDAPNMMGLMAKRAVFHRAQFDADSRQDATFLRSLGRLSGPLWNGMGELEAELQRVEGGSSTSSSAFAVRRGLGRGGRLGNAATCEAYRLSGSFGGFDRLSAGVASRARNYADRSVRIPQFGIRPGPL